MVYATKNVVAAIVTTMLLGRVLLRGRVNFAVKNNIQSYFFYWLHETKSLFNTFISARAVDKWRHGACSDEVNAGRTRGRAVARKK